MLLFALLACNPDPGDATQGVTYRPPGDDPQSGERGNVTISEVFWSGSVTKDGAWDKGDLFIELRNEGSMPVNMSGWQIEQEGSIDRIYVLPEGPTLQVGDHAFLANKNTGCFPNPDWIVPNLDLANGDAFELTLKDFDEHLIEGAGDKDLNPFSGGYDGVRSRSMEKTELMFGGEGNQPHVWHFYTPAEVEVPNNDKIAENCQGYTLASPGRPNSPDYSGAFASGSFE